MAIGDLISEWTTSVLATKVHPFEETGESVRFEAQVTTEFRGRLSGHAVGTTCWREAPDGTSVATYRGVLRTPQGETVRIQHHGRGVPGGDGKTRFRGVVSYRTAAPRLEWLNTTIAADETEADPSGLRGKHYEWL
jgi:hypothetical protein